MNKDEEGEALFINKICSQEMNINIYIGIDNKGPKYIMSWIKRDMDSDK